MRRFAQIARSVLPCRPACRPWVRPGLLWPVPLALSVAVLGVAGVVSAPAEPQSQLVDPDIEVALGASSAVPVIVSLDPAWSGGASPDAAAARVEAVAHRQEEVLSALPPTDFRLTHRYRHVPALAGRVTKAGMARLATLPGVEAVALDPEVTLDLGVSVPFIYADKLHRRGIKGAGARVAVLDTGIEANNLDLRDAVVDEACFITPASLCPDEPHVSHDIDGHGTSVSGIVASRGRRTPDGVAPEAEIVSVKVIEERNNAAGTALVAALDWIIERGDIDVVNMSLGSGGYEGECDDANAYTRSLARAIGTLRAAGTLTVASSGNDGFPTKMKAPACVKGAVSVGAVQDFEQRGDAKLAQFTNRNDTLDLLAPGVGIETTGVRGNTVSFGGTSAAAPHVAGAIALLRSAAPWAGPDAIETALKEEGQRPHLRYGQTTIRTIDVDSALDALERITPTATSSGPATATVTATRPPASTTPSPSSTVAMPSTPTTSPTPTVGSTATDAPSPEPSPTVPLPTEPSTAEPPGPQIYLPLAKRGG